MKVKCVGRLRHHFHGDYSATVFIAPDSADDVPSIAKAFAKVYVSAVISESGKGVIINCASPELDHLKEVLHVWGITMSPCGWKHCGKRCKAKEIDGLEHSVDVGPQFEVDIPIELDTSATLALPGVE